MVRNRNILPTMIISLLLLFSLAQAEEPKEHLTGSYGYTDEGGIWFLSVYANGQCKGLGWSDKYKDIYSLSGKATTDRVEFNFNGYKFSGLINRVTGLISGNWQISNQDIDLNRRMSGSVLRSGDLEKFAGEFSGTYSGAGNADSGTWTVMIFTDGHCEGEFRSNSAVFDEPSLIVNGGVNPSGGLIWEARNDSTHLGIKGDEGAVSEAGYITAEWHDSKAKTSGSISGSRENAMPLEVVNPDGGKDDNDFCFIRTLQNKD